MEIERLPRYPFRKNTYVVDHISYCMNKVLEKEYFDFVYSSIPRTSGNFRKPHLTVAYSYQKIDVFPDMDYEGEIYESIPKENILTISSDVLSYGIYKDPTGMDHLVMYTPHTQVLAHFQYYQQHNAIWPHGEYNPFIIVESDSRRHPSDVLSYPKPRQLVFDLLRYCRFGEVVDE